MKNIHFDRRGDRVEKEFVSRPSLLEEGEGWKCFHVPTHEDHFFDVYRYEFATSVHLNTKGRYFFTSRLILNPFSFYFTA